MNPSDAAYAGQEIYSRAFLRIYDPQGSNAGR